MLFFQHVWRTTPSENIIFIIYSKKQMRHSLTKPTKWHVHPLKTLISLGIRPVWSESSLCTYGLLRTQCFFMRTDRADAKADLSLHWTHMSFCWFCHAVAQMLNKNLIRILWMRCKLFSICVVVLHVFKCETDFLNTLSVFTNHYHVGNLILHWGERWLNGRVSYSGARSRGVWNLPPPCCVLEQDTLLPESTG